MPRSGGNDNALIRLDRSWSHIATDWTITNVKAAEITGENIQHVRVWRRAYVKRYVDDHGRLPPLSHAQMPGSRRTGRKLLPLDETHGHLARTWTANSTRIAEESGHFRASVSAWRRKHLAAYVAEGNDMPSCSCGKPALHIGSCGSVPAEVRIAAGRRILGGSDPDAVARTHRVDRSTALSWALSLLDKQERDAFRKTLRERRSERMRRMREHAHRRKAGDADHRRILALVHEGNPEGDDAIQEAYLAILEEGISPDDAAALGIKRAFRMSGIGWKPTSLDAPLSDDSETTRGDLLVDESPDQSASLGLIDRLRMEGADVPPRSSRAHPPPSQSVDSPRPVGNDRASEPAPRNTEMPTNDHSAILAAVIAAHKAAGATIKSVAAGSRVRNVDACSILAGRGRPTDGQLARMADHYGIPHTIEWIDQRAAAFGKAGARKAAKAALGRNGPIAPAEAGSATPPSANPVATRPVATQPPTPAPMPNPVPLGAPTMSTGTVDDASLIDSVVAALLSAKTADQRLLAARADLEAAEAERDAQRDRADAAEAKLAEIEAQLARVRDIVFASTVFEDRIAA